MVSNRDFRKLDMATQAELRRVAVGMVQAGKTRAEAAATGGVGRRYVGEWVAAVERSGEGALAGGRRGRRPGEQKTLSPAQEKKIKGLIARKCPDQLGLPFALWTREAVGMLIERETGQRFSSRSTIGGYLRDWGFTPQRPRKRATERHEPTVQRWLEHDYPAIVKRATTEDADIHWGDECGVSNQANYGRSFAPRGQTPVIPRPATRFTCSMISTLTKLGTLRFMIFEGALTAVIFLVPQVAHIAGYNRFSFTRASAVVKCQSALTCFLFRLFSQAATSSARVSLSGIRRSRHWPDKTLSSDSAISSQLPC